ncbi:MAG: hypothetical protein ACERLM_16425, partial [Acidimicrobiales bacterium]
MPDPQPRLTDVSGPTGAATDDTADQPAEPAHLRIVPWRDEVIDRVGHDPRSGYVERFWLGVLGPSTTLLLRRFAAELDHEPEGFELDLDETARRRGLPIESGRMEMVDGSLTTFRTAGMPRYPLPFFISF